MARFLACAVLLAGGTGCGMLPMGGGGGGFKPAECYSNQFPGDLSDAKEGRSMTYVSEASGSKTTSTVKVVGKDGDAWLVESWMDMGSMAYGFLFKVGSDKKVKEAWSAAKDDKEWTKITVKDPPAAPPGEGQKPQIKESSEKKDVKAGSFDSKRMDITVNVQGKDHVSTSWFSKGVWKLYAGGEHGGLVATEAAGMKMAFEAKAEDAKPTIELPKK